MDAIKTETALKYQKIIHDTEEFKKTCNDLNSWVKEVKDKEQKLSEEKETEHIKAKIRSHISNQDQNEFKSNGNVIEAEEEQEQKNLKADEYNERGNNHVKRGQYDEAILEYTKAIKAYNGDPKFFTNRALCYLRLEKYAECINDCNSAIELDRLCVKAYYRRMQANEGLNLNTQALKDCTTVLMINSDNIAAKESLERINQRLKKTGAYRKTYKNNELNFAMEGPSFSPLNSNMRDILPIAKPPSSRSKKPLKRIPIIDVIGPKDGKNYENSNTQISDEVIDKLFNGECGSYREVKKSDVTPLKVLSPTKESTKIPEETKCNTECLPTKVSTNVTQETKCDAELSSPVKEKPLPPAPTTTAQFYCNWNELSAEQKYEYLKSIQISHLNKVLGVGMDSETLSSLLTTFSEYYVRNEDDLGKVILELAKHSSLKILSLMLSEEDEAALSEIVNYLEDKASPEEIQFIKKSFNLM